MQDGFSEKLLIAKAEDTIKLSEKYCSLRHTDFLTPSEATVVKEKHLYGYESVQKFFGGYEDAERVMFISYPDFFEESPVDEIIAVIEITGRDIASLNHRDYLGSLMGLGIKREKIGDILVSDDKTLVFASVDIAKYIKDNLTKIGSCGIKIEVKTVGETLVPKKKTEPVSGTVQSVRLDSVLSVALKTSRSKTAQFIQGEKVQVNWKTISDVSYQMKEGEIFSVRSYGRFMLASVNGTTKKGRISITVEKYI